MNDKFQIRQLLRNGCYRTVLSIGLSIVSGSLPYYIALNQDWLTTTASIITPLIFLLGVISFNLRNKLIDLTLKEIEHRGLQRIDIKKVRGASKTITNMAVGSYICSAAIALSVIVTPCIYTNYIYSMIFAVFTYCSVQYIYLCFAYEELENQIITNYAEQKLDSGV